MMKTPKPYLTDIADAIAGIESAVAGKSFEQFESTWILRRAVERGLEIISEASRRLPKELKDSAPQIPWDKIAGIGNILRHGYDEIDTQIIWAVVRTDLAPLREVVEKLRQQLKN